MDLLLISFFFMLLHSTIFTRYLLFAICPLSVMHTTSTLEISLEIDDFTLPCYTSNIWSPPVSNLASTYNFQLEAREEDFVETG
jgi:hypothetical protein